MYGRMQAKAGAKMVRQFSQAVTEDADADKRLLKVAQLLLSFSEDELVAVTGKYL